VTSKSMLTLQNSRDFEKCMPGETYPTASHDASRAMNIKAEDVSDAEVGEEHPVPMTFVGVKSEHEVSCMSVSTVRHILRTTQIVRFSSHRLWIVLW
jgi:hypothetical protein